MTEKWSKAQLLEGIRAQMSGMSPISIEVAMSYVEAYGKRLYDEGVEEGSEDQPSDEEIEERGIEAAAERAEARMDAEG